jgi:tetratricopeptide (TPR) repeat protein
LAEDLERFLRDEPILARPAGRLERGWKWCKRNRLLAGVTAAAAILAVTTVISLFIGIVLVWQKNRDIHRALDKSVQERQRAETNFRGAIAGIDHMLSVFRQTDLANIPGIADVRRAQAMEAENFLTSLVSGKESDAPTRWQIATALVHVGNFYAIHSEEKLAKRAFQRAVELFDGVVAECPEDGKYALDAVAARSPLAELLLKQHQPAAAAGLYREMRDQLQETCRTHPDFADAANNYAWFLVTCLNPEFRDPPVAVEAAQRGVELAPDRAGYWNTLGVALYRAGEFRASIRAMQKAWALASTPHSDDCLFLAMAHWRLGEKGEAQRWYDRVSVMLREAKVSDCAHLEEAREVLAGKGEPPALGGTFQMK